MNPRLDAHDYTVKEVYVNLAEGVGFEAAKPNNLNPCNRNIDNKIQAIIDQAELLKFKESQKKGVKFTTKVQETIWCGAFFFIQMADCQLGFFEDNVSWEKEIGLLEKAVAIVNERKPRFVVLCGDMTHANPKEPKYPEQVADYKKIVSKIDPKIPLICLCGNHDVGNRPTTENIAAYESNFNTKHYGSFWVGGVHCVLLNSSLVADPSGAFEQNLDQMKWLERELEESNTLHPQHRLVFTHHPPFIKDEPKEHFYLPAEARIKLLELFAERGTMAWFSGHYHRNAYWQYKNIEVVTTSAVGRPLGKDPSGLRIVKVFKDHIEHHYEAVA